MSRLSDLHSQRNTVLARMTELTLAGIKTAEHKEEYRQLSEQETTMSDDITSLEEIERYFAANPKPVAVAPVITIPTSAEQRAEHKAELNIAFQRYLQNKSERRDLLTIGSAGAVVPLEFSGFISYASKAYAPITQFARTRVSDNGRPVKSSPRVDDTANGMFVITEGSGTPVTEVDPSFSASATIFTDLCSTGMVRYSNQLRDDTAFELEKFLSDLSSVRYGRGVEKILTRGVDSTGATTANNPGLINVATLSHTTSALASGIGFAADIVPLYDSLDAAYLPRSVWMMTSKTRNALLAAEDSTSRPYFVPAPNAESFDMLLGRPILINQSLDQIGANAQPIIFGSLYDALEVVTSETQVVNVVERYADQFESALAVYTHLGSTALQSSALRILKQAAS